MMSSLLSAVDALRASSGKKRGWPSTERSLWNDFGHQFWERLVIVCCLKWRFLLGSIPLEEKTSQIDHQELHAALTVNLNFQTIQTESMHTPAGVFEGDIKSTEKQRTNNMLLAGNPGEGSSQSNGLMESSLTSLTVVQVSTRSFFQT